MMNTLNRLLHFCRTDRVAAIIAILASTQIATAWAGVPEEARQGARLFADSSYKEAADAFRQATIAAPDDARWRYDLGLSEALAQDFESALNHLGTAARQSPPEMAAASNYNAGNVHLAMGNFAEAAAAYRQALIKNPADREAKHNLELSLKKLQEQQSQQGSQNDSTQSQKDQEQQQKQDPQQKQDQNQKQEPQENQEPSQDQQPADSSGQEPPPNPESQPASDSTLSRDQAERILRALADEEARLRNQAKKAIVAPAPGGKDW